MTIKGVRLWLQALGKMVFKANYLFILSYSF